MVKKAVKQEDVFSLYEPITNVIRTDFVTLNQNLTVQEAFDHIRLYGVGEKIVYFYVIDDNDRLVGVIPTRRLLIASLNQYISEIMIRQMITLPETSTIHDAYELFAKHKFLAFPVINAKENIVGVVDVSMFIEESLDIEERDRMDEIFESIGFRISQIRDASAFRAFKLRFSWLIATIGSGTICAMLSSVYEMTLAKSLVLAFFLTLVLGLGESVSMQSMTVTINSLRRINPTFIWFKDAFVREIKTALMLGTACGFVVGMVVWVWRGDGLSAITIGSSILLAICAASLFGLIIPSLLHALKLDPKIAAGPLTLAITDICTILLYFTLATVIL